MQLPGTEALSGDVSLAVASLMVVLVGVIIRVWYGSAVFHPRWTGLWSRARRLLVPLAQHTINRFLPISISVENNALKSEYVGIVSQPPRDLALAVDQVREVEVPLLAGLKTDWRDVPESGTFVWYLGPRPAGSPRWLRKYQVHVTCFPADSGDTIVTAHYEANSYRPDMWADHLLKGESHDRERGTTLTREALADVNVSITEQEAVPS